jgi:hypothetical protein
MINASFIGSSTAELIAVRQIHLRQAKYTRGQFARTGCGVTLSAEDLSHFFLTGDFGVPGNASFPEFETACARPAPLVCRGTRDSRRSASRNVSILKKGSSS